MPGCCNEIELDEAVLCALLNRLTANAGSANLQNIVVANGADCEVRQLDVCQIVADSCDNSLTYNPVTNELRFRRHDGSDDIIQLMGGAQTPNGQAYPADPADGNSIIGLRDQDGNPLVFDAATGEWVVCQPGFVEADFDTDFPACGIANATPTYCGPTGIVGPPEKTAGFETNAEIIGDYFLNETTGFSRDDPGLGGFVEMTNTGCYPRQACLDIGGHAQVFNQDNTGALLLGVLVELRVQETINAGAPVQVTTSHTTLGTTAQNPGGIIRTDAQFDQRDYYCTVVAPGDTIRWAVDIFGSVTGGGNGNGSIDSLRAAIRMHWQDL